MSKILAFGHKTRFVFMIQVDECADLKPYIHVKRNDDADGCAWYYVTSAVNSWSALDALRARLIELETSVKAGTTTIKDQEEKFFLIP